MPNKYFLVAIVAVLTCAGLTGCGGADMRRAKALERGKEYFAQENYTKARIEYNNALQIEPNDADARYYVAYATEKLNDLRAAAQGYQGALNVDGTHPLALAALARLMVFSGLPDPAAELVDKGLAAHPDSLDLKVIRAAVDLAKGNEQVALDGATAVLAARPDDAYAVALVAGIYRTRKEYDRASELLERALETKPADLDLRTVLAQLKLDAGDKAGAEAQLKRLVELRPNDPLYRQRLVTFYAATGQADAAEATLRDTIALDPKSVELKVALLNYLAQQRSFDTAEAELRKMLEQYRDDTDLKLAAGQFYDAHNLPEPAQQIYNELVASEGKRPPGLAARTRLAALAIRANKVDEARPLVEYVLAENPRDNDALVLRAAMSLAEGHALDAITDLRAVLRDQPQSAPVLRTLARAHVQNNEPDLARENFRRAIEADPANNELRLEFASYLARLGQTDEATPLIDAALGIEPQNAIALDLKSRTRLAAGDTAGALAAAEKLIESQPAAALGYYLQGLARESTRNLDGARASYELALEKSPRSVEPLGALARVLLMQDRKAEARERLERVVAEFPDHAVAANLLAEVLLADKQYDRAIALSEQALQIDSHWWLPYRTKALALISKGDKNAAKASYAQGLENAGYVPGLGMDLAALYERDNEPNRAIELYERMHASDPASVPLANNLAMLLATYREDTASYDKAQELVRTLRDSDNPAYLNTYGWVRFRQGRVDEAITYLRRASAAKPDSSLMHYHLAKALLANGQAEQARSELEKALSGDQPFPGKDDAKRALDSLPRTTG